MTFIYLDESGDLGMDCKESGYFIITAVKVDDEKTNIELRRIPKKVRRIILKKKQKKQTELKFSNSNNLVRKGFLRKIANLNVEIYALVINKRNTYERLRSNLPILYNYLIKILLEKVLDNINKNERLIIFLDRCMSKSQRENFENYIKTEFLYLFKDIPDTAITHEDSRSNEGLQATDFISGAFGYKYNTIKLQKDCNYYVDIIKNKIRIEKNDSFKN